MAKWYSPLSVIFDQNTNFCISCSTLEWGYHIATYAVLSTSDEESGASYVSQGLHMLGSACITSTFST